ncbi:hypothetical protein A3A70_00045 [candidate division WWE3 bacterium RIFCSPLOWO2_01_FULL_42_11]|uniref:Adhesin domain-containing protein n=1 Tax=candidate division WWE3 bacterium RIFCSPLOWO2_01_FULL_42_11 TaxID=1802627 RepID=A0A1F4VP31_UNCKA|nr:MAG: hypothetical protein A3A70_00045 [candidate division WWE3 bacterium RIFCSPLOWO2_01_FULL_42_11]
MPKIMQFTKFVPLKLTKLHVFFLLLISILIIALVLWIYQRSSNNLPSLADVKTIDYSQAKNTPVNQQIEATQSVVLSAGLSLGTVIVDSNPSSSITGNVSYLGAEPDIRSGMNNDVPYLAIESRSNKGEKYEIHLPANHTGSLQVGAQVGELSFDLSQTRIASANIIAGDGAISVISPKFSSFIANLQAGSGKISLKIPQDAGIKLVYTEQADPSKFKLDNDNYVQDENGFHSADFDSAGIQTVFKIGKSDGGFELARY